MPAVLRYSLLIVAPFLFPLLAFIGCGASPLPITHRPASELRLEIQIVNQYKKDADVYVQVRAFDGVNERGVAFADKASLTCDGVYIKAQATWGEAGAGSCPRQPPGGAYTFIYTDEHGASTTVTVPVMAGEFAILSPVSGSTVPIPTDGTLTVRLALPTPSANGSIAVESISALYRISSSANGGVFATVQDGSTSTSNTGASSTLIEAPVGNASFAALASDHALSATPTPPATPTPGPYPPTPTPGATLTPGSFPPPATATMTRDGATGTITLRGDYSDFRPSSGEVDVWVKAQVAADAGSFSSATASYNSQDISSSIVWTR